MSRRRRLLSLGGIALLVVVTAFALLRSKGPSGADTRRPPAAIVKVARPVRQTVTHELAYTGDVTPVQQASVYAKVTGTLEHVLVDMGQPVRRGQLLAVIDTTELAQQFRQASATYENAQLSFTRSRELFQQNLVARQELDNANAALKVAASTYEAARTRLSYAFITAPFSGVITHRFFDPGAVITPSNATLFTLMDLDAMKVIINVQEKDIPLIAAGKEAVLSTDAFPDRKFTGRITRYSQALDLATRTMAVEIDIDNRDHMLKPGMFASVTLRVDQHPNVLTVPSDAVMRDSTGAYLFAVVHDTARQLRIQTGFDQGGLIEVTRGLTDTQQIITTGQQFTRNGGPVQMQ